MQTLSAHFRTFALDLWGFGDSSKARDKYSISEYADLLEAFVDRLGIAEPAIIVGHGLGACVGLRYAACHPSRVARLAVVALPFDRDAVNLRILGSDQQSAVRRVMERSSSFPEVEAETNKSDPSALTALTIELSKLQTTADLEQITCPLLLIFGDQDPLVQHPHRDQVLKHLMTTDRALVTMPSGMHFPMLEQSAEFNRLILDFVSAKGDVSSLAPKEYWKRRTY